jgi:RNA polymerase sigma factor (sigma-70 family)
MAAPARASFRTRAPGSRPDGMVRFGDLFGQETGMDESVVWKLSDESLLVGLGSGDSEAAAAFVRRFQRRVFGLTFSILRDRGAAEEAAQESFVRAWKHSSAYDSRRGSVAAWLLTIARNVSINVLPARRTDPIDPQILLALEAKQPQENGHETRVVNSQLLREPLAQLPDDQRRALVLAVFYGYTARGISELDGVPLGTVKTRIPLGHAETTLAAEGVR